MTTGETDEFIIAYWKKAAEENDRRAKGLEVLAPRLLDRGQQRFMMYEAMALRAQARRFREAATKWEQAA
jgi:hypothetical protein